MHAPGVWSLYLIFELARGDPAHAKAAFLRGMAKLPWCKWFAVLGLTQMTSIMSWSEGQSICQAIDDKELRLHLDPFEEV
jgi:hypothetical protein